MPNPKLDLAAARRARSIATDPEEPRACRDLASVEIANVHMPALFARVEELEDEQRILLSDPANKLDGYRELGARAASAENKRDLVIAENARLRAELERVRTLVRDVVDDSETDLTGRMVVTMPAFLKMEQALAGGKEGRDGA